MAQSDHGPGPGAIDVVSLGPGDENLFTALARQALETADALIGYKTYIDLIPEELTSGKEVVHSGMRQEVDRVKAVFDRAGKGQRVALVCSGDAGVYGLAGLVLEIAEARNISVAFNRAAGPDELEINVLPGVSAATAAAALLGAPLMNDFIVISLSDLLTPWELILKRVKAAAEADLVTCLYNPRSKKRDWQLDKVLEIMKDHRPAETPIGLVRNAYRTDQAVSVHRLDTFKAESADMLSLVVIGNSRTVNRDDLMITPRGYDRKYDLT